MSWFEILTLIGFAMVLFAIFDLHKSVRRIANHHLFGPTNKAQIDRIGDIGNIIFELERHLFAIRYHVPFIEMEDEDRIESLKGDESYRKRENWKENCQMLQTIDGIKDLVKSIDMNLKRPLP